MLGAGGDGSHARLVRGTFAAPGVGCELRLVLRDSRGVWGSLGLLWGTGAQPFDPGGSVGAAVIAALRGLVTAAPLPPVTPNLPAGVTVIGPDHRIRAATPHARLWWQLLDRRHPAWLQGGAVRGPVAVGAAAARVPLVCGPAAAYGRWIGIQAQRLGDHEVAICAGCSARPEPAATPS